MGARLWPKGAAFKAHGTLCLGLCNWRGYGRFAGRVVVVMSAARHTPGPWEQKIQSCGFWSICTVYGAEQGWIEIHAPNGSQTADVRAETTANARLIAAAPDLLEALQHLMVAHGEQLDYAFQQAQEAIAKATGEAA